MCLKFFLAECIGNDTRKEKYKMTVTVNGTINVNRLAKVLETLISNRKGVPVSVTITKITDQERAELTKEGVR